MKSAADRVSWKFLQKPANRRVIKYNELRANEFQAHSIIAVWTCNFDGEVIEFQKKNFVKKSLNFSTFFVKAF